MMPDATLSYFNIETLSHSELEQRRRNIISVYGNSVSIDDMSLDHLKELAAITQALRKKTVSGPKSGAKGGKGGGAKPKRPAATVDDLFNQL